MGELSANLICPHCGYAQRDAWEIDFGPGFEGETELLCSQCEERFEARREVAIYYRTKPVTDRIVKEDAV